MTRKHIVAALAIVGVIAAGYYAGRRTPSDSGVGVKSAAQSGWVVHQDPSGFVVERPETWSLQTEQTSGRALVRGAQGEEISIWPVFVPGGLDPQGATALLGREAAARHPTARWDEPQLAAPTAVRITGRDAERQIVAAAAWVPSPSGAAAFVYEITATPQQLAASMDAILHVLGSFRLVGRELATSDAAAVPAQRWVSFRDPVEGAWTLEVPEGWTPRGGVVRIAPMDVRKQFEAAAPTGARVFMFDARIPTYSVPSEIDRIQGRGEGAPYSPGYGVRWEIRRYLTGQQYAEYYVRTYLAPRCGELTITGSRDQPALSQAATAALQRGAVVPSIATVGDVKFTCQPPGSPPLLGFCVATTRGGGGIWTVQMLIGYLAPASEIDRAHDVMVHVANSFKWNPEWEAMQGRIAGQTSAAIAGVNQYAYEITGQVAAARAASEDELARRRSNATLGVDDVTDPVSGRQFKVESGSNYYWVDAAGNIAGTRTATAPAVDFRQLLRQR